MFSARVGSSVLANSNPQLFVFDQTFEISEQEFIRIGIERHFHHRIIWKLRIPTNVGHNAANTAGHQAAKARAGFSHRPFTKVQGDIGLVDAALELFERDMSGNLDSILHTIAPDQFTHVVKRVGFTNQRITKAVS